MANELLSLPTETLLQKYRQAAIDHNEWSLTDPDRANASYRAMLAVFIELQRRGKEAIRRLAELMNDPEPSVRLWSAYYALSSIPTEAEAELARLADENNGIISLDAKVTLQQWRAGQLVLPKTPE